MKIVIAVDSFKGSLTSMEAGNAVKNGILRAIPQAQVVVRPLADGGEGTTDAFIDGLGGQKVELTVSGPMGKPAAACYGWLPSGSTAVMEMAAAAGITMVPDSEKDPMRASTYGVGEMILHAVKKGCREFILGIGGSATNDGGLGMLTALGYEFTDKNGCPVPQGAAGLGQTAHICAERVLPELKECTFKVACDVTNPLCGANGATYIYGPQKGVTADIMEGLDQDMAGFADVTAAFLGADNREVPGAGAAGGLGFALMGYLGASLEPGVSLLLEATGLEEVLKDADVVVTGEGRLDGQTAMGKAPVGVAGLAKKYGITVVAFAGGLTKEAVRCNAKGIDAFFPIVRGITTLEEAMDPENARQNMADTTEQVFRLIAAR